MTQASSERLAGSKQRTIMLVQAERAVSASGARGVRYRCWLRAMMGRPFESRGYPE